MAIVLAISGRRPLEFDAESITIGSDPAGTIALTDDDRIKPRHAVIRRVAGRWLVEARESDSIQVGNSQPARVHWLNAGDVIHLVENGPAITFQPAQQDSAASYVPAASAPLAAPVPLAAQIPLAGSIGPAKKPDLPPLFDSLFEPIAKSAVTPIATPPVPPNREPQSLPEPQQPVRRPARQPEGRKRRENGPRRAEAEAFEIADQSPVPVVEVMNTRALPRFQDEGAALTRSGTASDATFGWVLIWVVVGLGVLLVGAIIWFVSFPSSDESDERAVPAPATRIYENRGSR